MGQKSLAPFPKHSGSQDFDALGHLYLDPKWAVKWHGLPLVPFLFTPHLNPFCVVPVRVDTSPRAAEAASGKTRQPLWMLGSQAKLFRVVMLGRVRRSALQTRSDMKEERHGVQGRGARRTGVHVEGEERRG